MNKKIVMLIPLTVAILAGCGSNEPSAADQAKLKEQFTQKSFDINRVPVNERAMVQGYIDRAKQAAASAHSKGP